MDEPVSVESRRFKIAVFVGSAVTAGVSIANVIYYNKMRKDTRPHPPVSKTAATTMLWINVVIFVVAILLMIWSIWALLFSRATRAKQQKALSSAASGGYQQAQTYLSSQQPIIPYGRPAASQAAAAQAAAAQASQSGIEMVPVYTGPAYQGGAPPQVAALSSKLTSPQNVSFFSP